MDAPPDEEEALLFNLVYCSRATVVFLPADIETLVEVARRNNAAQAITGWLVYSNGIFFQWLEGARESVKRLMASITADRRHNTIVILSEAEEVRGRLFADWDMELVSAAEIRAVLFDAIDASSDAASTGALKVLLEELDSKVIDS